MQRARNNEVQSGGLNPRASGAALVEGAVVVGTLLTILLGMLDLGLAVLQYNTVSEAARKLAREAVVHGEMAPPQRPAWGPEPFSGTAADGSPFAEIVRPLLVAIDPQDVAIQVEWPDGGNRVDQRVQVTVACPFEPILPFLFGREPRLLSAVSTLRIAH